MQPNDFPSDHHNDTHTQDGRDGRMSKKIWLLQSSPKNLEEHNIRDPEDHFVYIMAHLDEQSGWVDAPIKVGISKNPTKRRKEVQAVESGTIVLVAQFAFWKRSHAFKVERTFHRVCDVHRVRGEWFDISPADAVALMNINLQAFACEFLGADETADDFTNFSYLNVPGALFDVDTEEFKYTR